jgi:hypothetical protein
MKAFELSQRGRKPELRSAMLGAPCVDICDDRKKIRPRNGRYRRSRSQWWTSYASTQSAAISLLGVLLLLCGLPRHAWIDKHVRRSKAEKRATPRAIYYVPEETETDVFMSSLDPHKLSCCCGRTLASTTTAENLRHMGLDEISPAESFETKSCKAQYEWQLVTYPTCNTVHEIDMNRFAFPGANVEPIRHIAHGFWRDVWLITEETTGDAVVLKTQRYEHDFSPRNLDRHRRDALAMERLSTSKYVVAIYAFGGCSGLVEFADGGNMNDAIRPKYISQNGEVKRRPNNMTSMEKLHIGKQNPVLTPCFMFSVL